MRPMRIKSCATKNSFKFMMKLCLHMDDISYLFCLISFSFRLWHYFISIHSVIIILFNLLPIITTSPHTHTHLILISLHQITHIYFSHHCFNSREKKNLHRHFFLIWSKYSNHQYQFVSVLI